MKKIIYIVTILAFAGTGSLFAQGSIKEVKGAKNNPVKVEKADVIEGQKDKVKDVKAEQQAVVDRAAAETRKEIIEEIRMLKAGDDANSAKTQEKIKKYEADLAKLGGAGAEGIKDVKGDMNDGMLETKEGMEAKKEELTSEAKEGAASVKEASTHKGKPVIMDKEYGQARAEAAKKKIEASETAMSDSDKYILKSQQRIAAAKEKLAAQIAAGDLSEEQIAKKQAAITRAEKRLDAYIGKVKTHRERLDNYKSTVIGVYNKEN